MSNNIALSSDVDFKGVISYSGFISRETKIDNKSNIILAMNGD